MTTKATETPNAGGWTAGPWHVNERMAPSIIYAADGYAVANVTTYHGKRREDTPANARLIEAAPELVTSLQDVLREVSRYDESRAAIRDARALLARLGMRGE